MSNFKNDPYEKFQEEQTGRDGYSSKTGFQSPTDDHRESQVNWVKELFPNPTATFWFTVEGDAINEANIHPGDTIFYDRSLNPVNGSLVFVTINNAFTIRIYHRANGKLFLLPINKNYRPIKVHPDSDCQLEGVIIGIYYKPHAKKYHHTR